ncbi:MAG TPA: sugar ABC transporter ATP-binding protein [Clostridiales bacterium]|nr:sugar ABC transporter ATP-binding protein [Clostridiales bacterium]
MKTEILSMQNVCIGDEMARYALNDFQLQVYQGEMVNLLGVSGSGKTALYFYFIGEELLREGKVVFHNQIWKEHERFSAIRDMVCLGQKSTLIPNLSIAENLCIITGKRKVKGVINKKAINYRVNLLLKQYAPELSPDMLVNELTIVQCHVVELLRSIENEAKLVFIDDAFSSYGQMGVLRILELLRVLKERNISIIYASRKRDQLTQLAERIIILRQGKAVKTFYSDNYNEELCRKWLVGNPVLTGFQRKSYRTGQVVLNTVELTGPCYISNMNLKIHRGEVVGLYDMNNSANLEVTDILVGNRKAEQGRMFLEGKNYAPLTIDDAIASNVGYIPKDRDGSGVVGSMSFAENLLLPIMLKMSLFTMFKNERVNRYLEKEYLEELGIKEQDKDKEVSSFDSYVKTNVIFRKWILSKPALLICEEICEETDITMRNIIYKALEELAGNGAAVLVTSSNLGELKVICDTIYVLNSYGNGERVKEIQKIEILQDPKQNLF